MFIPNQLVMLAKHVMREKLMTTEDWQSCNETY
jgi:hypothetical protein